MPPARKPAATITWKPIRSASRSMSREKLSWLWIDAACVPSRPRWIASGLLHAATAAIRPMIRAPPG
jgi:hypothetical protein